MKNNLEEMKSKGLFGKYIIKKADGSKVDKDAEYFVLRLNGDGDPKHIQACRDAILCYGRNIKDHLPLLAADILEKYGYYTVRNGGLWFGTFGTKEEAENHMKERYPDANYQIERN